MAIDNDKIKDALDSFENDDFISAKDTLKGEIKDAVSDFFKEKLDLQNDLEPKDTENSDTDDDTGKNTDTDTDDDTGSEE